MGTLNINNKNKKRLKENENLPVIMEWSLPTFEGITEER